MNVAEIAEGCRLFFEKIQTGNVETPKILAFSAPPARPPPPLRAARRDAHPAHPAHTQLYTLAHVHIHIHLAVMLHHTACALEIRFLPN